MNDELIKKKESVNDNKELSKEENLDSGVSETKEEIILLEWML